MVISELIQVKYLDPIYIWYYQRHQFTDIVFKPIYELSLDDLWLINQRIKDWPVYIRKRQKIKRLMDSLGLHNLDPEEIRIYEELTSF